MLYAVISILLFSAIVPSITANAVDHNKQLYEFTTEFCGINGFEPVTIMLTKNQIDEIELLFDHMREKLESVNTKQATIQIFKETISEMNNFGLLKDKTVELQESLINYYSNSKINNLIGKSISKNPLNENNKNYFCLVAGKTSNTYSTGPLTSLFLNYNVLITTLFFSIMENSDLPDKIYSFFERLPDAVGSIAYVMFWGWIALRFLMVPTILPNKNPLPILYTIGLGQKGQMSQGPAEGWVFSLGLNGKKNLVRII